MKWSELQELAESHVQMRKLRPRMTFARRSPVVILHSFQEIEYISGPQQLWGNLEGWKTQAPPKSRAHWVFLP